MPNADFDLLHGIGLVERCFSAVLLSNNTAFVSAVLIFYSD